MPISNLIYLKLARKPQISAKNTLFYPDPQSESWGEIMFRWFWGLKMVPQVPTVIDGYKKIVEKFIHESHPKNGSLLPPLILYCFRSGESVEFKCGKCQCYDTVWKCDKSCTSNSLLCFPSVILVVLIVLRVLPLGVLL